MKVKFIQPGTTTFQKIYRGNLFFADGAVYVKSDKNPDEATVIYKTAGLMNAGGIEKMSPDKIVLSVVEATFIAGDVK